MADGMVVLLPDDLLANVLRRLPPRTLAVSRCVCAEWRALIDDRRLLRTHLLPLRLEAFFFIDPGYTHLQHPYFFSPPSTARRIGGRLDFLDTFHVDLILFDDRICNPATRQWMHLPTMPPATDDLSTSLCLVYDSVVSPHHFKTLSIPLVPCNNILSYESNIKLDSIEESLLGYLPRKTLVFSSRKWRWEERTFVCQRGGEPGDETIADLHICPQLFQHPVVYLKGAIYVHCINDSLMRIILSNDKYQMIKSPVRRKIVDDDGAFHLGKCDKGIYFALLWNDNNLPRFQVWLLNESLSCCGQMEWMPKTNISLEAVIDNFPAHGLHNGFSTSWIINYLRDEAIRGCKRRTNSNGTLKTAPSLKPKIRRPKHAIPLSFFLGFIPTKRLPSFGSNFQERYLII